MNAEERKIIDSVITNDFLARNQAIVNRIIQHFSNQMNVGGLTGNGIRFYLKGGNALSILAGDDITGDYDFQLMPGDATYATWVAAFPDLDRAIITALKNTITSVVQEIAQMPHPQLGFNDSSFIRETLQAWARNPGNQIYEKRINLDNLEQRERRNYILKIGPNYGSRTFQQIITDPQYVRGRIENLALGDFETQQFDNQADRDFGPMIYVNYTIPGFILYRMVYSFRYAVGEEVFNLKSEIIDISVPRPGSAEVHISQEGVVTHFRPAGGAFNFDIPGWGYHFYENINLLQEIQLEISGSPHKRAKRIDRLKRAIVALKVANALAPAPAPAPQQPPLDYLLKMNINEPLNNNTYNAPYGGILGYYGAIAFNVQDYNNAYNMGAIADLREKIGEKISEHFKISERFWGKSRHDEWEKLVYFRVSEGFDKGINKVSVVKSLIAQFLRSARSMEYGVTYQYISPLDKLPEDALFPCDYVVIEVVNRVFTSLADFYRPRGRYKEFGNPVASFSCIINDISTGKPGTYKGTLCVIFQRGGVNLSEPGDAHVGEVLRQSILESQRYGLAKAIEHQ